MKCRHCQAPVSRPFIDLGSAPPSNAYLSAAQLREPETRYPLRVLVCENCWLVQTEDVVDAHDLFTPDYAYFSSYSQTWLSHVSKNVAALVERFELNAQSLVVEVASNDGHLLKFVRERGIPCYGIEPTAATARAARRQGIDTVEAFFGQTLARDLKTQNRQSDVMIANNVLAHVPDINDFVSGFATLLKPTGVAVFEFPHLLNLVQMNQFDTIYHEHFSYLSLTAVERIFRANGLQIFDVEELPTHGGSLRVYAGIAGTGARPVQRSVAQLLAREQKAGVCDISFYDRVQSRAEVTKDEFLRFILAQKEAGLKIAAYGAAAKGNTLLNFAGVRPDLLPYVADANPAKQGKFLPGSRIPVVDQDHLRQDRPDWVLILPWNIRSEIIEALSFVRDWGGRFAQAIPKMQVS